MNEIINKTKAISKPLIEPHFLKFLSRPTIQSTDLPSSMKNLSETIIKNVPPKAAIEL